jgi:hypothetical protein
MKIEVNQREQDLMGFVFFGILFAGSAILKNPIATTAFGLLATMFLIESRYEAVKELIKNGKRRKRNG